MTDKLTAEEIAAIDVLAQAATPGPYEARQGGEVPIVLGAGLVGRSCLARCCDDPEGGADAELIAALLTAWPALKSMALASIELREEVDKGSGEFAQCMLEITTKLRKLEEQLREKTEYTSWVEKDRTRIQELHKGLMAEADARLDAASRNETKIERELADLKDSLRDAEKRAARTEKDAGRWQKVLAKLVNGESIDFVPVFAHPLVRKSLGANEINAAVDALQESKHG